MGGAWRAETIMKINKRITDTYCRTFAVEKSGLVAISVSARCQSKKQLKSNTDEDLRVEINRAPFRELPPEKNIQQFNLPCTFNGSQLRGLKKTVTFLTVLEKGEHEIRLIPKRKSTPAALSRNMRVLSRPLQKSLALTRQ